jgi:hypothetical protein
MLTEALSSYDASDLAPWAWDPPPQTTATTLGNAELGTTHSPDVNSIGNPKNSDSPSSSLVILTSPDGSKSGTRSADSGSTGIISGPSLATEQLFQQAAHINGGPCSKTWGLSQWVRSGRRYAFTNTNHCQRTRKPRKEAKKDTTTSRARKRGPDTNVDAPRRGPFEDQEQRANTALVRQIKACIRCRMQHIRVRRLFAFPLLLLTSKRSVTSILMTFLAHVLHAND